MPVSNGSTKALPSCLQQDTQNVQITDNSMFSMSTSDKPPSHLVFYLRQQIERKKRHFFGFYKSGKTGFLCLL